MADDPFPPEPPGPPGPPEGSEDKPYDPKEPDYNPNFDASADNEFAKQFDGCMKRKGRFMFFGEVHSDFKPKLQYKNKNFITMVRIFLFEGVGYYGHVIISTCKSIKGYVDVVDEYYPVKIDVENSQFIVIEQKEGTKRQFRLKDQLRCENIDEMTNKVISAITDEPLMTIQPALVQSEEVDDADWWKQGEKDPNWWMQGGAAPMDEGGGLAEPPPPPIQRAKDDMLPQKPPKKEPTDRGKDSLGDVQIPDGIPEGF